MSKRLSAVSTYEIGFLFTKLIGACVICHAVFVNGENITQLHVQSDPNCDHLFPERKTP